MKEVGSLMGHILASWSLVLMVALVGAARVLSDPAALLTTDGHIARKMIHLLAAQSQDVLRLFAEDGDAAAASLGQGVTNETALSFLCVIILLVSIMSSVLAAVEIGFMRYFQLTRDAALARFYPGGAEEAQAGKVRAAASMMPGYAARPPAPPLGGVYHQPRLYNCVVEHPHRQFDIDVARSTETMKNDLEPEFPKAPKEVAARWEWTAGCFQRVGHLVVLVNVVLALVYRNHAAMQYGFSAFYCLEIVATVAIVGPAFVWAHRWELVLRVASAAIGFIPAALPYVPLRVVRVFCGAGAYVSVTRLHVVGLLVCVFLAAVLWAVGAAAIMQSSAASGFDAAMGVRVMLLSLEDMCFAEISYFSEPLPNLVRFAFRFVVFPLASAVALHPLLGLARFPVSLAMSAVALLQARVAAFAAAVTETEPWFAGRHCAVPLKPRHIVACRNWLQRARRRLTTARQREALYGAAATARRERSKSLNLDASSAALVNAARRDRVAAGRRPEHDTDVATSGPMILHPVGVVVTEHTQRLGRCLALLVTSPVLRSWYVHWGFVMVSAASIAIVVLWRDFRASEVSFVFVLCVHALSIAAAAVVFPRDASAVFALVGNLCLLAAVVQPYDDSLHLLMYVSILRVFTWQISLTRTVYRAVNRALRSLVLASPLLILAVLCVVVGFETANVVDAEHEPTGARLAHELSQSGAVLWLMSATYLWVVVATVCYFVIAATVSSQRFSSPKSVVIDYLLLLPRPSSVRPSIRDNREPPAARRRAKLRRFAGVLGDTVLALNCAATTVLSAESWAPFVSVELACAAVFALHATAELVSRLAGDAGPQRAPTDALSAGHADAAAAQLHYGYLFFEALDLLMSVFILLAVVGALWFSVFPPAVYSIALLLKFAKLLRFTPRDLQVALVYNAPLLLGTVLLSLLYIYVVSESANETTNAVTGRPLATLITALSAARTIPQSAVPLFTQQSVAVVAAIILKVVLCGLVALLSQKIAPYWMVRAEGLSNRAGALYAFLLGDPVAGSLAEDGIDVEAAQANHPAAEHGPDVVATAPAGRLCCGCDIQAMAGKDFVPRWQVPFLLEGVKLLHVSHQRGFYFALLQLADFMAIRDERERIVAEVYRSVSVMSAGGPDDSVLPPRLPPYPQSLLEEMAAPDADDDAAVLMMPSGAPSGHPTPRQNTTHAPTPQQQQSNLQTPRSNGRGSAPASHAASRAASHPASHLTPQPPPPIVMPPPIVLTAPDAIPMVSTMRLVQALAVMELGYPCNSSHDARLWMGFWRTQRRLRAATMMQSLARMHHHIQAFDRARSHPEVVAVTFLRTAFRNLKATLRAKLYAAGSLADALNNAPLVYNHSSLHRDFCARIWAKYDALTNVPNAPLSPLAQDEELWVGARQEHLRGAALTGGRYNATNMQDAEHDLRGGGGSHDFTRGRPHPMAPAHFDESASTVQGQLSMTQEGDVSSELTDGARYGATVQEVRTLTLAQRRAAGSDYAGLRVGGTPDGGQGERPSTAGGIPTTPRSTLAKPATGSYGLPLLAIGNGSMTNNASFGNNNSLANPGASPPAVAFPPPPPPPHRSSSRHGQQAQTPTRASRTLGETVARLPLPPTPSHPVALPKEHPSPPTPSRERATTSSSTSLTTGTVDDDDDDDDDDSPNETLQTE
jgi:hypothetical protein